MGAQRVFGTASKSLMRTLYLPSLPGRSRLVLSYGKTNTVSAITSSEQNDTHEVIRGGGFRDLPMVVGNDAPNKLSRSEPLLVLAVSAPRLRLGRLERDVSSEDTRFGFGDAVLDEEPSLQTPKDSTLSFPGVGDSAERPNKRRRCFKEGPVSPCEKLPVIR